MAMNVSQTTALSPEQIMTLSPVIAVVSVDSVANAVALSGALTKGGVRAIEITLRTPCAVDAIKAVANEVEDAVVGAGTVLSQADIDKVVDAGARFLVSPGFTDALLDGFDQVDIPALPGVANASQAMQLAERGYHCLKFFPAQAAGGSTYLKSLAGPLPQFKFCPTGGVSPANAAEYLALDNVLCVGGSWLAPSDLVKDAQWQAITQLALDTMALNKNRLATR